MQIWILRILLAPLALIYALGVGIRLWLYKYKVYNRIAFSFPVISVGNLSVGGTGKTPHVEYLAWQLNPYLKVGILSRGYKRTTVGFKIVESNTPVKEVGDEPLQYKLKFPFLAVAVAEQRALGIPQLLKYAPDLQLVILDDAFQHLGIKPSINILLTAYQNPFYQDYLLPLGRLREFRKGYQRADIIVITKCPKALSIQEQTAIKLRLKPLPHQEVFFSFYNYYQPYGFINNNERLVLDAQTHILLLTALAGTDYLLEYLSSQVQEVENLAFEDHHYFSKSELAQIQTRFNQIPSTKKYILTTEKDAVRLTEHLDFVRQENLPIFVLPIEVGFLDSTSGGSIMDVLKTKLLEIKY